MNQRLAAQQVAEALSVSRQWVYDHQNDIGFTKMGKGQTAPIRFLERDVERFMAERFHGPTIKRGRPRQVERKTGYRVEVRKAE